MTRINENFKTVDNRKFSLKRGFSFFLRGNLVLGIILLIILSGKNSWDDRGIEFFVTLLFQSELMIVLLSFAACFKPRVYGD